MMKRDQKTLRKAQKAIIAAFIDLIKKKGFLKVTVQEILTAAQVNKSTFYAYYLDKFDLLSKVEDQLLAGLREIEEDVPFDLVISDGVDEGTQSYTERFLHYMYDNGELFTLFTTDEYCNITFMNKNKDAIQKLWKDKNISDRLAVPQMYAVSALVGMIHSLISEWAINGFQETPEEFIDIYRKVIGTVPKSIFV